jgi:predicted transcriptional regulator
MYMVKTSVYLPDDLKERLAQAARTSGESEATIIRSALEQWLAGLLLRPRSSMVGAIAFDDPGLAAKVDEVLAEGFGRD